MNAGAVTLALIYLEDPVICVICNSTSVVITLLAGLDYQLWPQHLYLYIETPLYMSLLPTVAGIATMLLEFIIEYWLKGQSIYG